MLMVRNYVAPSAVEGLGVFAAEPIAKGDIVWRFDPRFDRLMPREEYESAPGFLKEQLDRYAYPMPGRPDLILYEVDNGRFMNHADEPNTDFRDLYGARALRDIAAGEELTCNYTDFFADYELLPNLADR